MPTSDEPREERATMDYALAEVVTAVRHGSSTDAQRWFTLVCDEYRDLDSSGAGDDWDQFVQRLTSRASSESFSGDDVGAFTDRANSHGGAALVRRLADLGPDQLTAEYQQILDEESAAPEGRSEEYDEGEWSSYLAENATMWNGTEDTWTQFRDWFLHYATERSLGVPAKAFLDYADSQGDKGAVFAQYGITVPADAGPAQPEEYDESAWSSYLAENATMWNGSEDTWTQFRDWFQHYATERSLGIPAKAFLNYADSQDDKVAVFAQYGITLPTSTPAAITADADAVAAAVADRVRARLLAEVPGAADLPPGQLQQLIDSVLSGEPVDTAAPADSPLGDPAEVAQSVIAAASERIRAQLLSEVSGADRLPPDQLQRIIDDALAG